MLHLWDLRYRPGPDSGPADARTDDHADADGAPATPPSLSLRARPARRRAEPTEPTSTDGALPRHAVEFAVAVAAFVAYLVI